MTTKSTSVAKLPYRVDSGESLKIKDANGHSILTMMQVVHNLGLRDRAEVAATAAFLALAANSHHAMKEALEAIANHPACQYRPTINTQYHIGVADGHRVAASMARAALKEI